MGLERFWRRAWAVKSRPLGKGLVGVVRRFADEFQEVLGVLGKREWAGKKQEDGEPTGSTTPTPQ